MKNAHKWTYSTVNLGVKNKSKKTKKVVLIHLKCKKMRKVWRTSPAKNLSPSQKERNTVQNKQENTVQLNKNDGLMKKNTWNDAVLWQMYNIQIVKKLKKNTEGARSINISMSIKTL